jgi:hypothetical protein
LQVAFPCDGCYGISTPSAWPFWVTEVLKSGLLETLRLQKSSSTQVQIGQSEVYHEAIGVLGDAAIANFFKAEDALEDVESMFDSRTHARFRSVRHSFAIGDGFEREEWRCVKSLAHGAFARISAVAAICRVAPNARLVAAQEIADHAVVVNVRGVVTNECTTREELSTPMYAFMPKYHSLPFLT